MSFVEKLAAVRDVIGLGDELPAPAAIVAAMQCSRREGACSVVLRILNFDVVPVLCHRTSPIWHGHAAVRRTAVVKHHDGRRVRWRLMRT